MFLAEAFDAAADCDVRWVQRSSVSVYPDVGDMWITEQSPLAWHRLNADCLAAEHAAQTAARQIVVLRFGHVWGCLDTSTATWLRAARNGWDLLDLPDAFFWPTLEIGDAAAAVAASLTAPAATYNVADPAPLSAGEVRNLLSRTFEVRMLHPLPPAMPSNRARFYYRSHRLDSSAFMTASGWVPRTGPFPRALAAVAAQVITAPYRPRLNSEVPW
jgi:nucleoside-diphosphate-sugar epimerase